MGKCLVRWCLIALLFSGTAFGSIHLTGTCSPADIRTARDVALAGGILFLPPCNESRSAGTSDDWVEFNKNIVVRGSGMGVTVLSASGS